MCPGAFSWQSLKRYHNNIASILCRKWELVNKSDRVKLEFAMIFNFVCLPENNCRTFLNSFHSPIFFFPLIHRFPLPSYPRFLFISFHSPFSIPFLLFPVFYFLPSITRFQFPSIPRLHFPSFHFPFSISFHIFSILSSQSLPYFHFS